MTYGHNRDGSECAPEVCGGVSYDPCTYSPEEVARFEAEAQAEYDAWAARVRASMEEQHR